MRGPLEKQALTLLDTAEPELLWITGYRTSVVSPDKQTEISDEFLCHNNLDLDVEAHQVAFGDRAIESNTRMFTLTQGLTEIVLPKGFGVPISSDTPVKVNSQVLNLNMPTGSRDVRHKVNIEFVRDSEAKTEYKALFAMPAFVAVSVEATPATFGVLHPTEEQEHATCLPGKSAGYLHFEPSATKCRSSAPR